MFLSHFEGILNENIEGGGDGWIIVDAFGGSGLLSHTAKRVKPKAQVIYNDFDGYTERLVHIDDTNTLRKQLYNVLSNSTPKRKMVSEEVKAECIRIIQDFDGYKDLNCLASWLLFSGEQVATFDELYQNNFWNRVRQTDYPSAEGYLDDVEIVRESYHTLLPRFLGNPKVLFVLDPPYLFTRQESYRQDANFGLVDFLKLVNMTRPPYIFFSPTKSGFVDFIRYLQEEKIGNWRAFENASRVVVNSSTSYSGAYEDNIFYKF